MAPSPADPYLLREAETSDAAAIRALTREAYAKWVPVIGREPLPMTADYERAVREHRFDLLFAAERLVALIETDVRDDHVLIVNVAVAPDLQGQGLGRRMLTHAEALARIENLREVRLYTNARFEADIAIYRRLGYAVFREETLAHAVVVHMKKPA